MSLPSTQPASMELESAKTTPAGIDYPGTSSTRSESPLTVTSSPSSRGSRSVSSMKGLMPLTLSPSLSSSCSSSHSITVDDGGPDRLEDCLPELLARDLEMSADIFTSKDLTAGAPGAGTPSDGKGQARASNALSHSPYAAASARVQILGAIEEQESMSSLMDQEDRASVDHHSESASMTSHDSSEEAEPPSFRHRGSVVTIATSVGSVRLQQKILPLPERPYECSWIDVDSDREERENETLGERNAGSVSLRSRTPSSPGATGPGVNVPSIRTRPSHISHRRSHSIRGYHPIATARRHPARSTPQFPLIPSSVASSPSQPSISCARSNLSQTSGARRQRSAKKPGRTQSPGMDTVPNGFFTPHARNVASEPSLICEASSVSDGFIESADKAMYSSMKKRANKQNTVFVRPPSPPQLLRSVQSWLNSSLQPYSRASHSEDNARVVPLPPDAVETLRVSVACFPETMLLTSSLTVETIRSYAKKVRQPSMDTLSIITRVASSPESPRKSLWRKVVTYKRGSQLSEPTTSLRPSSSRHGHGSAPTFSADADTPQPWIPLKKVFGCCSDYICDALYAHIVAYNYVSALVARSPMAVSGRSRPGSTNARGSQQKDDIPKKAASLLGFSAGGDMAASMGKFPKRLGSSLADWTREGMVTQPDTVSTAQDNALRVIQSGLLRCVTRLVATAKLMAEDGTGEERMVEMETEDADILFMRSLCEIVRMAEDSA